MNKTALSYRKTTVKFTFNAKYTRPKAYEVERFLRDIVKIELQELIGIHLSIVASVVYVKLKDEAACERLIRRSPDGYRFCHADGNVGVVSLEHVGLGLRTIRVFELPFEIPEDMVKEAFEPYGTVLEHSEEKWTTFETFTVLNGVRQLRIELRKHIPSYVSIAGCRAIVIYDGQPRTCSGCGQEGHVKSECSQRRIAQLPRDVQEPSQQMTSLPITYVEAFRNDASDAHAMTSPSQSTSSTPDLPSTTTQMTSPHPQQNDPQQNDTQQNDPQLQENQDPATPPSNPTSEMGAVPPEENTGQHPTENVQTRGRKQRSPKHRKKRRLSSEEEKHTETDENDSGTDHASSQRTGPEDDTLATSVPRDVQEQQGREEKMDTAIPQAGVSPPSHQDGCNISTSPTDNSLGNWAEEMEQEEGRQEVDARSQAPAHTEPGGTTVHGPQ